MARRTDGQLGPVSCTKSGQCHNFLTIICTKNIFMDDNNPFEHQYKKFTKRYFLFFFALFLIFKWASLMGRKPRFFGHILTSTFIFF